MPRVTFTQDVYKNGLLVYPAGYEVDGSEEAVRPYLRAGLANITNQLAKPDLVLHNTALEAQDLIRSDLQPVEEYRADDEGAT